MRVVIAPDKLRGTYTADEAAAALARGWQEVRPGDDIVEVPLADGGEGTAAAILRTRGGEWREAEVHDALGRPCTARFARLIDGSAVLDVAEACGAARVADLPRDPIGASSRGAGELIRAAIDDGALRVVIGVGGTASSDAGIGLRDGLGRVPDDVELVAALDVENPLVGPAGAAKAFGPQKGATAEQVAELEELMRQPAHADGRSSRRRRGWRHRRHADAARGDRRLGSVARGRRGRAARCDPRRRSLHHS